MIKVDQDMCIGCGACAAIDSEHFGFNDNGMSEVIKDEVTDSVREACSACPVGAITITDEPSTNSNDIIDEVDDVDTEADDEDQKDYI